MTTAAPVPAPFPRRLAALVYDLLAVVAIVMVVGLLCQLATGGHVVAADNHSIAWWYSPLQGLVVAAYFVFSWRRGGQTLGMRPWKIRVSDLAGHPIDHRTAFIRLVVGALPLLLLALYAVAPLRVALWAPVAGWAVILLPAAFDPRRRALHDMASGSMLRRLG
jgi:uncharacterized RDD family membrane protein YckC